MSIIHKGHALTQEQLDAIVPVMNLFMRGEIPTGINKVLSQALEEAINEALEQAGCPMPKVEVIRDPIAEHLDSLADLAEIWKRNRDRGRHPSAVRSAMLVVVRELVAAVDVVPVRPEPVPTKRQYYYRVEGCDAPHRCDPSCICWHDFGTGPLAGREGDAVAEQRVPDGRWEVKKSEHD